MTILPYAAWLALVAIVVWLDLRWRRRFHYHSLWCRVLPQNEVHEELYRLLGLFADRMEAAQLPYWLDAGTLLGAWRGGAIIPWDDDADVFVMHADHQRILHLAGTLPPEYRLIEISRLWSLDKLVPGLASLFPCRTYLRLLHAPSQLYVDIFEMDDGEELRSLPLSVFHSARDVHGRRFCVARSTVFPLGTIGLGGREFSAPSKVRDYLELQFGSDLTPDR